MGRPKGIAKTGGRQKGSPNKRTAELNAKSAEAAAQIAKALGDEAFDGDAHAFLMSVYKDSKQPIDLRTDAAKAAIRYEKPALASVDSRITGDLQILDGKTEDELDRIARSAAAELGISLGPSGVGL